MRRFPTRTTAALLPFAVAGSQQNEFDLLEIADRRLEAPLARGPADTVEGQGRPAPLRFP